MEIKTNLQNIHLELRAFLALFLITITIGISFGLFYVYLTTDMTSKGTVEQFNGSEFIGDEIPEKFPKPLENMILTTHNHIITFSLISLCIGFIFYFNTIITGKIKLAILIEPFISTLIMFFSMWTMKYYIETAVYIMIIAAILTYLCWYFMIAISLYDLYHKRTS